MVTLSCFSASPRLRGDALGSSIASRRSGSAQPCGCSGRSRPGFVSGRDAVDPAEGRRILGIAFCPTCDCDTMPLERTGCCGFCDTLLVDPNPDATEDPDLCVRCGDVIDREWAPGFGRRPIYCSDKCKKRAWEETPAGRAYVAGKHERKLELQRLRRAA